jgi:hypothetical protein
MLFCLPSFPKGRGLARKTLGLEFGGYRILADFCECLQKDYFPKLRKVSATIENLVT